MISLQPFLDELDLPIYIFPSHEHKNNETTVMCCLHVHTAAQQRKREIFYCIASSRLLVGFLFLVAVSTNAVGFLYVASVEDGSGFVQSKASKRQLANLIGCWRHTRFSWLRSLLVHFNKYRPMNQESTLSKKQSNHAESKSQTFQFNITSSAKQWRSSRLCMYEGHIRNQIQVLFIRKTGRKPESSPEWPAEASWSSSSIEYGI